MSSPLRPLGRIVRHDPRSLRYLVPETDTPVSASWKRRIPVLDQGQLGSCTGNAATGHLGTDPFYDTVPNPAMLDEDEAVALYSAAERLDGGQGYPPEDQGSSGLSVAQACRNAGLIAGYVHIASLAAAHHAITQGPFIVGSNWYDGMDTPDDNGLVHATGSVRGGHEYECIGYDAPSGLWEFVNSWGSGWGVSGHFFYTDTTFAGLLAQHGDATQFVPLTQPAPTPTPSPVEDPALAALYGSQRDWARAKHVGANKAAALASQRFFAANGLDT